MCPAGPLAQTHNKHTHTHTHAVIRTVSECSFTFHLLLPPPQANAIYGLLFSSNAVLSMALAHLSTFIPFFLDYNSLFFFLSLDVRVVLSCVCVYRYFSYFFFFIHCYPLFVILRFTFTFFFWKRNACSSHQNPQSTTKFFFVCLVKHCGVHI